MEITNEIIGESFSYDYSKKPLTCRISEQMALNEILEFCISINEKAVYSDDLLSVEVEEGTFLYELLYGLKSGRSRDGTAFLQEMMNKKSKKKSNGSTGRRIVSDQFIRSTEGASVIITENMCTRSET